MTDIKGNKVLEKLNGEKKPETLIDFIKKMKPELEKALPRHISADRILRIVMTSLRVNPKLASCDKMSFVAAVMQSAQLGLEPNTPLGEAYLIPYNSKMGPKVQFQMGYQGIITLCQNTNKYRSIYAHAVYKNDIFKPVLGLHKDLIHVKADEPEGDPIYYYACYHLINGGEDFSYMSRNEVEKHRDKTSPSAKFPDSSWKTSFDSMALKTVLKRSLKYAPKSIELSKQLAMDETVKTNIAPDMSEVPPEEIDITPPIEEQKEIIKDGAEEIKKGPPGSSIDNAIPSKKKKRDSEDEISDEDLGITGQEG